MVVLAFNSSPPHRQLQFSPEEVLGMVLNYSRSLAEDFAGEWLRWGQRWPGSLGSQWDSFASQGTASHI